MPQQTGTNGPVRYMQGIAVPSESVRPTEFFARTRRHIGLEKSTTWAGFGGQDVVELKKSDVLGGLTIRFVGSLVVTVPSGTAATTARWPYDLIRQVRFTANGASNLINVSGLKLKVREFQVRQDLDDRGVPQTIGGATKTQGTLSKSSESWGVGSNSTVTAGTYNVDLEWFVPVAEDQVDLSGAIFCATSSTDLTLSIDWEQATNIFALTGGATAVMNSGRVEVHSTKYAIPIGSDGQIVIPDLSLFHSLIQSRHTSISNAENEVRLVGQGAGKSLLRVTYQLWNGASPQAPLAMNSTNFAKQAWRYAGNETPDEYSDGQVMRLFNERFYNSDIGSQWGFGCHEFAAENAFRDAVDMGTTSELRLVVGVQSGVTVSNPGLEYVQETIFQAGAGA
ncbi:hypothetical protein ABZ341_41705 [Streptomyces sp. NPDC006173]|uniref:hypothetical protein n=1 Tax=Streptomyces sp. NPDC006173 TaxID=3155349 RepID=UPI0033E0B1BD